MKSFLLNFKPKAGTAMLNKIRANATHATVYATNDILHNELNGEAGFFFTFYVNNGIGTDKFSTFITESEVGIQMFEALQHEGELKNITFVYDAGNKRIYNDKECFYFYSLEGDFYTEGEYFTEHYPVNIVYRYNNMVNFKHSHDRPVRKESYSIDLTRRISDDVLMKVEKQMQLNARNNFNNMSDYDCL